VDPTTCLPLEGDASETKLDRERVLLDRLPVSRSEMPMHLDRRFDHAPRDIVHVRRRLPEPPLVLRRIGPFISGPLRPLRPCGPLFFRHPDAPAIIDLLRHMCRGPTSQSVVP